MQEIRALPRGPLPGDVPAWLQPLVPWNMRSGWLRTGGWAGSRAVRAGAHAGLLTWTGENQRSQRLQESKGGRAHVLWGREGRRWSGGGADGHNGGVVVTMVMPVVGEKESGRIGPHMLW